MATEEKNQLKELTEEELKAVNGGGDFKPCIPELLRVRCKSMCLGIDILKSEEEVFDI